VELKPIFVTVFTESALQTIYNKEFFALIHIYSGVIVLIYLLMFSFFLSVKKSINVINIININNCKFKLVEAVKFLFFA